jgi:hypothetical protein
MFSSILCMATPSDPTNPLWLGLTHYWKLDDAVDAVTSTVGTVVSTVTFGAPYGKIGNGALGGASGLIDTNCPGPVGNEAFTVAYWVYHPTTATGPGVIGLSHFVGLYGQKDGFPPIPPWDRAYVTSYLLVAPSGSQQLGGDTAPFRVTLDAWHHVAFSYDGAAQRLYIDGVKVATGALTTANGQGTDISIGNYVPGGPPPHFEGVRLDEVGTWSRALADAQVAELFNAGAGKQPPA